MNSGWASNFEQFFHDVGSRPSPNHSIERIDNDGNYEPGNVRWALPEEQVRNRRNSFKVDGKFIDIKGLAKELKVGAKTIKKLLCEARFSLEDIREYSTLSHYQKIKMGKSINDNAPLTLSELRMVKSPVAPSPKRHPLWCTWHSLRQRCYNKNNKDYHNYGGKGITVCEEWSTFVGFWISIIETIGNKPSQDHQLDRIDPSGNYEPSNVRWATKKQQAQNKMNTLRIRGIGICARDLGNKYEVSADSIAQLVRIGWDEKGIAMYVTLSHRVKKELAILKRKVSQEQALEAIYGLAGITSRNGPVLSNPGKRQDFK